MIVKKPKKQSIIFPLLIFILVFYYVLRVLTLISNNGGFDIRFLMETLDNLYKINTPIVLTPKNLLISLAIGGFAVGLYATFVLEQKENIQKYSYGSAEWKQPSDLNNIKEKRIEDNRILTSTEQISKNSKKSHLNQHLCMIGRPGTGKSKFWFEPNILNLTGGLVCTDPKGELLRDCGNVLLKKGYEIKVLDLDDKRLSNHYNPFMYIRKVYDTLDDDIIEEWYQGEEHIKEDDVMILINVIMKNTKSQYLDTNNGDPFWEKAEILFLQALFYYILEHYKNDPLHQNFTTVMNLLREAKPNKNGVSNLDILFDEFEMKYGPEHIAIKQWKHFKVTEASQKMMSTIVMTATSRLSVFNVREIENLVSTDDMELDRIGMPIDEQELETINSKYPKKSKNGKVAWFVKIKPSDDTFNFIATIMYTQLFQLIDVNSEKCGGSLSTPVELYLEEFAQMGEIPRFKEELAYVRSLNVGVVICLQSLSQLKEFYKETWETIIDCCDVTMLLGSNTKETLEYFSIMLGKKTWWKKSTGRTFSMHGSSNQNWDILGRELATLDEIKNLGFGNCILFITNIGAFYSKLYDIKKHPYYPDMYDSWDKSTIKNKYKHSLKKFKTEDAELKDIFSSLGFKNFQVLPTPTIEEMTSEDLKNLEDNIYTPEEILNTIKG